MTSIDWEGEIWRLDGKGGSQRSVPLHPLAAETLHAYLAAPAGAAGRALFVSCRRGALTVRAAEFLVGRHTEVAGLASMCIPTCCVIHAPHACCDAAPRGRRL